MKNASLLLIALLLVPCMGAGPPAGRDITPASATAGSNLDLVNPGPVEPGEFAFVHIKGLTLAEIEAAMDEDRFDLTTYPLDGVVVKSNYDFLFRRLELMVKADKPGRYLLKLHLIEDGKFKIAATEVIVEGDGDEEDGDDEDGPDPPEPPQPDRGPWQVLFLCESKNQPGMTVQQNALLKGLAIRERLKKAGHVFRASLDDHSLADGGSEWSAWQTAVDGKSRPLVALAPVDGGDIVVHPLPADEEGLMNLLGGDD